MNRSDRYIKEIAEKKGISSEEVRKVVTSAIANALQDDTPAAEAFWKSVPSQDEYPTIDEIMDYLAKCISE